MSRSGRIARLMLGSAVVGALVLLGGVIANGSISAFSAANADDSPGACDPRLVDRPGLGCRKELNELFEQGKQVFRFDTFGDEDFWGGQLQLHRAIAGETLGGVGAGVSPKTALSLGLKVDSARLPKALVASIRAGRVDLDSPATTVALLKLNAVVGIRGFFDRGGTLTSIGTTCALCHSTVDDSFAPGIGKRLDGWPNRDLNVGAIVASGGALRQALRRSSRRRSGNGTESAAQLGPRFLQRRTRQGREGLPTERKAGRYGPPTRIRPCRRQPRDGVRRSSPGSAQSPTGTRTSP